MADANAVEGPSSQAFLPPYVPGDVVDAVFVAKPGKVTKADPSTEKVIRVLRPPPIFLVGVVLLVAVALGGMISNGLGVSPIYGVLTIGAVAGVPLVVMKLRGRVPKADKSAPVEPAKKSDETFRLRLMATRNQANAIGPLRSDAFEPFISPIYFALRGPPGVVVTIWIIASLAIGTGWHFAKEHIGYVGGPPQFYEIWACFGIAASPFAFLWPTYVRVSPGRLDLFQYGSLGSGKPRVRTFDLRTHKVLLNLAGKTLVLTHQHGPAAQIDLGLWSPKPLELARAIFEAARWTHERPAIPNDELVG